MLHIYICLGAFIGFILTHIVFKLCGIEPLDTRSIYAFLIGLFLAPIITWINDMAKTREIH